MYDLAGGVSAAEARELRVQAERLLANVLDWLRSQRSDLVP